MGKGSTGGFGKTSRLATSVGSRPTDSVLLIGSAFRTGNTTPLYPCPSSLVNKGQRAAGVPNNARSPPVLPAVDRKIAAGRIPLPISIRQLQLFPEWPLGRRNQGCRQRPRRWWCVDYPMLEKDTPTRKRASGKSHTLTNRRYRWFGTASPVCVSACSGTLPVPNLF